jgi:hypothetical protein
MALRNHRPRRLVGAFEWSICHYCGGHATTEDHIVPRAAFPVLQSRLPAWYRIHNVAPACKNCNNEKGHFRSDCSCELCDWLWTVAIKQNMLKPDFVIIVKPIVLSPG